MDDAIYLILALALAGLIYLSLKVVPMLRHVGFLRFAKALGALILDFAVTGWKLISRARTATFSSPRSEPLDLSGTGGRYNARTGNYDNGQDPFGIYPDDDRRL